MPLFCAESRSLEAEAVHPCRPYLSARNQKASVDTQNIRPRIPHQSCFLGLPQARLKSFGTNMNGSLGKKTFPAGIQHVMAIHEQCRAVLNLVTHSEG